MNPMGSVPLSSAILALGWTLMHFVWQGLLVASLLACANALLDRASSNARYLAACAAMLLMLAAPIATFATLSARARNDQHSLPAMTVRTLTLPARQALAAARLAPRPASRPAAGAALTPSAWVARGPFRWSAERFTSWLPWVVVLWGMGVAVLSLRLLGGWTVAQRLRRGAVTPAVSALQSVADRIAVGLRIARPVRLVESLRVQVPTVIGWLKPIVLVPSSALAGLTPAQLEAVLAHELAHVRRHDYLANLVQTAIETLLFYHPAVWWVGRQIRAERENCCDDVAVAWCGSPVLYARALTELEGLRATPQPALAATGGSLVQRVMRLVRGSERPRPAWMVGAVGIAAVFAMVGAGVTLTAAQQAPGGARLAAALARMSRQARVAAAASLREQSVAAREASRAAERQAKQAEPCAKDAKSCSKADAGGCPDAQNDAEAADLANLADLDADMDAPDAPPATPGATAAAPVAKVPVTPEFPATAPPAPAAPPALTADKLVELAGYGITPSIARDLAALGFADPDDMVKLVSYGVTREYIRAFRKLGYDHLSADDYANMRQAGVTADYVQDLRDMGHPPMEVEELIAMRQQGVTAEYAAAMKWLGFGDLPLDQLIEMRNQGVSADYVARLRVLGYRDLGPDDLIALRSNGIPPEYAGEMRMFGLGKLPVETLIAMYQASVTPDYVAGLRGLGYTFTPEELIAIRQQSVTTEWLAGVAAQGYAGLAADDLIALRQQGVDGGFIREVRDAGYGRLPVESLIRLRQIGLVSETPARARTKADKAWKQKTDKTGSTDTPNDTETAPKAPTLR